MLNLIRAEWRKVTRHHVLTLFTLGLPPVGLAVLVLAQTVFFLADVNLRGAYQPGNFVADLTGAWGMMLSEIGVVGRLLPGVFMAAVVAGEYQSGMWKNVLPGNPRWQALAAKLIVLAALTWLSLAVLALVTVIGNSLLAAITGVSYWPEWTGELARDLLKALGRESLLALTVILLLICIATLSALWTRSTLGAFVATFLFTAFEALSLGVFFILARFFDEPEWVNFYQYTATYSLSNLRSWLAFGVAYQLAPETGFTAQPEMMASAVVLTVWLAVLAGLALWKFQRQDITS